MKASILKIVSTLQPTFHRLETMPVKRTRTWSLLVTRCQSPQSPVCKTQVCKLHCSPSRERRVLKYDWSTRAFLLSQCSTNTAPAVCEVTASSSFSSALLGVCLLVVYWSEFCDVLDYILKKLVCRHLATGRLLRAASSGRQRIGVLHYDTPISNAELRNRRTRADLKTTRPKFSHSSSGPYCSSSASPHESFSPHKLLKIFHEVIEPLSSSETPSKATLADTLVCKLATSFSALDKEFFPDLSNSLVPDEAPRHPEASASAATNTNTITNNAVRAIHFTHERLHSCSLHVHNCCALLRDALRLQSCREALSAPASTSLLPNPNSACATRSNSNGVGPCLFDEARLFPLLRVLVQLLLHAMLLLEAVPIRFTHANLPTLSVIYLLRVIADCIQSLAALFRWLQFPTNVLARLQTYGYKIMIRLYILNLIIHVILELEYMYMVSFYTCTSMFSYSRLFLIIPSHSHCMLVEPIRARRPPLPLRVCFTLLSSGAFSLWTQS